MGDSFVSIPESNLDSLSAILDLTEIGELLAETGTDYSPESLFRALLIREWHDLSYERLSDGLRRDLVYMNFCGFSLAGEKPDKSTLARFRDRMTKAGLWKKALARINGILEREGLKVSGGSYMAADVSLIPSCRRPRKALEPDGGSAEHVAVYSDDADAAWVKKGKKVVYGYGFCALTDQDGYVESLRVGPANESESAGFEDAVVGMLGEKGRGKIRLLYDKGADSKKNREALKKAGFRDGISRRKPKGKKQGHREKKRNRLIAAARFVVERTFGTMKKTYGFSRAKLKGIPKVSSEAYGKSIAYNLRRGGNLILSIGKPALAG